MHAHVGSAFQIRQFDRELLAQLANDLCGLVVDFGIASALLGLQRQPRTLQTRQRTNRLHILWQVSQGFQSIQRRVNPTIQRNVGRTHIAGVASIVRGRFHECSPVIGIDFVAATARAINLTPQIPAQRAAQERVCDPVFLANHASHAHSSRCTVGKNLGERAGVFTGDYTGCRPTNGRGAGRKGIAAGEKGPFIVSRVGA